MNLSSATLSPGFLSGWYLTASFLYADFEEVKEENKEEDKEKSA